MYKVKQTTGIIERKYGHNFPSLDKKLLMIDGYWKKQNDFKNFEWSLRG